MVSNLKIDNNLIKEALKLSKHDNENVVIQEALQEFIQKRQQLMITELFGTIDYEDDYNYKQQRYS